MVIEARGQIKALEEEIPEEWKKCGRHYRIACHDNYCLDKRWRGRIRLQVYERPALRSYLNMTKHYSLKNYEMDESIGFLIKLASTSMERALAAELKKRCPEATVAQWKIIMLIGNNRCDTAAGLAEALECDMGSVTRTLDRLEAKGLVKRERSRTDKRLVHLSLTAEGSELLPNLPEVSINAMNEVLKDFTMEEVGQLKEFLRRIIRNGQLVFDEIQDI